MYIRWVRLQIHTDADCGHGLRTSDDSTHRRRRGGYTDAATRKYRDFSPEPRINGNIWKRRKKKGSETSNRKRVSRLVS